MFKNDTLTQAIRWQNIQLIFVQITTYLCHVTSVVGWGFFGRDGHLCANPRLPSAYTRHLHNLVTAEWNAYLVTRGNLSTELSYVSNGLHTFTPQKPTFGDNLTSLEDWRFSTSVWSQPLNNQMNEIEKKRLSEASSHKIPTMQLVTLYLLFVKL